MKLFSKAVILFLIILSGVSSCKKDVSSAKVSVAEGTLSFNYKDTKEEFKIFDIQTSAVKDSLTIIIKAYNKDSTKMLTIGLEKIPDFKEGDYVLDDNSDVSGSRVYVELMKISGKDITVVPYKSGVVSILHFLSKTDIQGEYEVVVPSVISDTAENTITGEFYASYVLLDPERIDNLPIPANTMEVDINSYKKLFTASGGAVEGEKGYVINGNIGDNEVVTLVFKYFVPQINKSYKIGEAIVEGNDTGYIQASYFLNGTTYVSNNQKGSGQITVTKLASSTIQGKFDFKAISLKDTSQKMSFDNGLFYAKIRK